MSVNSQALFVLYVWQNLWGLIQMCVWHHLPDHSGGAHGDLPELRLLLLQQHSERPPKLSTDMKGTNCRHYWISDTVNQWNEMSSASLTLQPHRSWTLTFLQASLSPWFSWDISMTNNSTRSRTWLTRSLRSTTLLLKGSWIAREGKPQITVRPWGSGN